MADRSGSRALADPRAHGQDALWMLADLLASIVGADDHEVSRHLAAMSARGSAEGQREIVAALCGCDHPRVEAALDLLAHHHPEAIVAREARKSAMRLRTRAVSARSAP